MVGKVSQNRGFLTNLLPFAMVYRGQKYIRTHITKNSWNDLIIRLPCINGINGNVNSTISRLKLKTFWPFDNIEQWLLAKVLTFPAPVSNTLIKSTAVECHCPWIRPGYSFKSVADFKSGLNNIPAKGGEWKECYVTPKQITPVWAPPALSFWLHDSLDVLKDIIGDVRLANHMKWAPETLYNGKNERIYSELWTGNWWIRTQVGTFSNALLMVGNYRSMATGQYVQ